MATIASKLQQVRARLAAACDAAQRPVESVTLLAVSKTFGPEQVREAALEGQLLFGENYVQEAVLKIDALADSRLPLEWHLIGPLQSNKARIVAERFAWVHSVDRLAIAQRLSEHRPADLPPLQVCLQVNISDEESKSGFSPDEALRAAAEIAALPRLRLRGLMVVPRPSDSPAEQRAPFARLREMLARLRSEGLDVDTLSMGMSADLEAAVAEGATIVRIGSAIFGERAAHGPA
ncbi:YggS family pyridoxal phosphate-dependent enzyme [soil metagenome]